MGVSDGDVVKAIETESVLTFESVVEPSENCTIRSIFFDRDAEDSLRKTLNRMECSIEGADIDGLISLSVHKDKYDEVESVLQNAFELSILDYQEAALR